MFNSNWRKDKKRIRNKSNSIQRTGYFLCCNYHPCKIDDMYPFFTTNPRTIYDAEVEGQSLIDGKGASCSMYYCDPIPLTEIEANEMANFAKEHTWLQYCEKYIYNKKLTEQEKEDWLKYQSEWNFRTNGKLI